jgi:hypothetical protein
VRASGCGILGMWRRIAYNWLCRVLMQKRPKLSVDIVGSKAYR